MTFQIAFEVILSDDLSLSYMCSRANKSINVDASLDLGTIEQGNGGGPLTQWFDHVSRLRNPRKKIITYITVPDGLTGHDNGIGFPSSSRA